MTNDYNADWITKTLAAEQFGEDSDYTEDDREELLPPDTGSYEEVEDDLYEEEVDPLEQQKREDAKAFTEERKHEQARTNEELQRLAYAFVNYAIQLFQSIPVEERSLGRQRELYDEVIKNEAYHDLSQENRDAILRGSAAAIGIVAEVLPPIATTLLSLEARENALKEKGRSFAAFYTEDVIEAFETLTEPNDLYSIAFLEKLALFRYDQLKWNKVLRGMKDYGLDEKALLMLLEDVLGDTSEELTGGQILAAPDESVDFVVEGLMTRLGMSMLVAPPKAGKTRLTEWLAYCIATGKDFLGLKVNKTPVFYIGVEAQRQCFIRDFQRLCRVFGDFDTQNFISKIGVPQKRLIPLIIEEKMKQGYTFIILDMIIDCVILQSTNDYAQVYTALAPVRRLAQKYNAHVLCVHHASKQGDGTNAALGSQAFRGVCPLNMWITGEKKEPRYLTAENRTSAENGGVDFDGVELILEPSGAFRIGARKARTKEQQHIYDAVSALFKVITQLQAYPERRWNTSAIKDVIGGSSNGSTTLTNKAVSAGIIAVVPGEGKSNEKVYQLTERFQNQDRSSLPHFIIKAAFAHEKEEDIAVVLDAFTSQEEGQGEM